MEIKIQTDAFHDVHSCFSVIEVMGRRAGFIALWSGIAGSARAIFADSNTTAEQIVAHLRKYHFTSGTIVLAEGAGKAEPMAEIIERELHVHTRANVLAFIQRGGNPTAKDRVYGIIFFHRSKLQVHKKHIVYSSLLY